MHAPAAVTVRVEKVFELQCRLAEQGLGALLLQPCQTT